MQRKTNGILSHFHLHSATKRPERLADFAGHIRPTASWIKDVLVNVALRIARLSSTRISGDVFQIVRLDNFKVSREVDKTNP